MATRLLLGRELHNFYPRSIGIVGVQAIFAIATDFRAVEGFQATFTELRSGGVNIFYTKREMILNSQLFVIGIRRDVEHVFDPVRTVGNLQFVPVGAVVFEAAVPVQAKSKK